MTTCDVCGNEYDRAFTISMAGRKYTFDSLSVPFMHCGLPAIIAAAK